MKTIIVATDYSATANNALHFAANLALIFNANLVLFNVCQLSVHARNALVTPEAIDHMVKNNEDRLKKLADETAQRYKINVTWFTKTTDTVTELENYATTNHADLVVMGMDSNLAEYKLFGNTTTSVIRRMKFPVLVVPNDAPFKNIEKILYACEYTYLSEDNHLDLLKEITRKFDAELQIFHVETRTKEQIPAAVSEQINAMDTIMGDVDHTYSFVENPKIGPAIMQGVEAWKADLLVMVPHKAGFLESLLKGSTTRQITLKTRVPLLVLPNLN